MSPEYAFISLGGCKLLCNGETPAHRMKSRRFDVIVCHWKYIFASRPLAKSGCDTMTRDKKENWKGSDAIFPLPHSRNKRLLLLLFSYFFLPAHVLMAAPTLKRKTQQASSQLAPPLLRHGKRGNWRKNTVFVIPQV